MGRAFSPKIFNFKELNGLFKIFKAFQKLKSLLKI